jgi:geranylgeranyl diphosphate synthase type I
MDADMDTDIDAAVHLRVERVLAHYLAERRAELPELAQTFAAAVDTLSAFALGGGKRIRPTFAWWGWRAAGGEATGPRADAVLTAISSLELVQTCALVHDDLLDASDLSQEMRTAARLPYQAMRAEMFAGQYLDVLAQAESDESEERALGVARLKTAAYTVERPLHMGVALAGADEETVAAVRAFGVDIGVAFQLRDDLLGVYGDPSVTGKPAGDDLREGKQTLLVALGLKYAARAGRRKDVELLRGALGDPQLRAGTIERVRALLVDVGAVAELERRIDDLRASGLAALGTARLGEPGVSRLTELAIAATRRDR